MALMERLKVPQVDIGNHLNPEKRRSFMYRGEPVSIVAICVTLFSSIGGFMFGYDIGYISGVLIMPPFQRAYGDLQPDGSYNFSIHKESLIVGILSLGSLTGALLGVPWADFIGRRGAIFAAACVMIVGVIVQVAPSANYGAFLAGRYLAGLAVGALSALVPLYQGEVSPKALRGAFTSSYQIMITLGIVLAYGIDYATAYNNGASSYKIPIAIQIIFAFILAAGTPFLPRSPRESILHGDENAARQTIGIMHACSPNEALVDAICNEISSKIEEEKLHGSSYRDAWDFRSDLKTGQRTLIGCFIQSFQQLTGANFIFYYGTAIFQAVNPSLNSYKSQLIFGSLDSIGTFPGLYFLDRFGRRRTMITGALVMGFAYMAYAIIGHVALYNAEGVAQSGPGAGMVTVICIFVLGYGASWGPGGWVNTGEIAPLRTKAKQLSFIAASNWTWNFLLSYFSNIIADDIGALLGLVFFGCNLAAAAFVYLFLPELAGLSLEEINTCFQQGISPRKSIAWNHEIRAQGTHYERRDSDAPTLVGNHISNTAEKGEKSGNPKAEDGTASSPTHNEVV